MKEALDNAMQELKRVDHLFYVSLKYTRTVDMMRHMIERIISAIDYGIESLLKHAKEGKLVANIPTNPGLKCELVKKIYSGNQEIIAYMNFYMNLKKILRADFSKREEYRRHVTMISTVDGKIVEVSIDTLKEDYETTKNFINFIRRLLYGEEES